jgi:hypothetical protein
MANTRRASSNIPVAVAVQWNCGCSCGGPQPFEGSAASEAAKARGNVLQRCSIRADLATLRFHPRHSFVDLFEDLYISPALIRSLLH